MAVAEASSGFCSVLAFLNALGGQGPFSSGTSSPLQKWGLEVMGEQPGIQDLVAWGPAACGIYRTHETGLGQLAEDFRLFPIH